MHIHIGVGVPYHVRVYAVNTNGRGSYCITTDFGSQQSKQTIDVSNSLHNTCLALSPGPTQVFNVSV